MAAAADVETAREYPATLHAGVRRSIASRPPEHVRKALIKVPMPVTDSFDGCGNPIPLGIEGLAVLDLGCGTGRDSYVCASLVGPTGLVTGIDVAGDRLEVARTHVDAFGRMLRRAPGLHFVAGDMAHLADVGVQPESIDLCISNGAVAASPRIDVVLASVFRALKLGGEFCSAGVCSDRRLPEAVRGHAALRAEGIAAALYEQWLPQDFVRQCRAAGFTDPRVLERTPVAVTEPAVKALVGAAQFCIVTYRCFKVPDLETLSEDYGQLVVYKGTLPGQPDAYVLDRSHTFEAHRPERVCGNTAAALGSSWLRAHFDLVGDRSRHFGLFSGRGPRRAVAPTAAASDDPNGSEGGFCVDGMCY